MRTFFRYIFRKTVPTFNPFQGPLKDKCSGSNIFICCWPIELQN